LHAINSTLYKIQLLNIT